MILTILLALLSPLVPAPAAVAQFKPCVFPNPCGSTKPAVVLAQFKPCVFPNTCGAKPSRSIG